MHRREPVIERAGRLAAERRKNSAHGASRGWKRRNVKSRGAPKEALPYTIQHSRTNSVPRKKKWEERSRVLPTPSRRRIDSIPALFHLRPQRRRLRLIHAERLRIKIISSRGERPRPASHA